MSNVKTAPRVSAPAATLAPNLRLVKSDKAVPSKRRAPAKRPAAKKKKSVGKRPLDHASQVVRLCTIYAQSMAAYQAGFYTDTTGNADFAGDHGGEHSLGKKLYDQAETAMSDLNAIRKPDALDHCSLIAKCRVLSLLVKTFDEGHSIDDVELEYVRGFALDVEQFLTGKTAKAAVAARDLRDGA